MGHVSATSITPSAKTSITEWKDPFLSLKPIRSLIYRFTRDGNPNYPCPIHSYFHVPDSDLSTSLTPFHHSTTVLHYLVCS